MKNKNTWTFTPETITVNGITFPASYSLAKTGDVYVFAAVKTAADSAEMPVRLHITPDLPMHAEAALAAEKAKAASKAEKHFEKPAEAPAPVETAPVQEAPAPVETAPVPETSEEAPAKAAPVEKPWIGSTISGKGWAIVFDEQAGRTRVTVDGTPAEEVKSAIEQAGFYWSAQLNSWNKKLTCKAFRAAQALACTLNALA